MNVRLPETRVFKNEQELVLRLAENIVFEIQSTLSRQPRFTLALSGGKTPEKLYALLAEPPFRAQMPWNKIHLFMGDERFVPPHHADCNYRMVRRALLEKVQLPPSHMHAVPTQADNPRISAMEYERELRFFFSGKEFPRFDLVLLGVGEDGHTASLFPGTPGLDEKKSWVAVSQAPQDPRDRVTLTFPAINHARRVIFIATGPRKSAILKEILNGPPDRYPAQRVQPVDGKLEWWIDKAAGLHSSD